MKPTRFGTVLIGVLLLGPWGAFPLRALGPGVCLEGPVAGRTLHFSEWSFCRRGPVQDFGPLTRHGIEGLTGTGWVSDSPTNRPGTIWIVADQRRWGIIKPSEVYHTAYQDYLQGRFQLAIEQFENFVKDFPKSSYAPQAHYYLGESYYNIGNLTRAAENFSLIITRHKERLRNYQNSRQVPPALFRLGGVYEEIGKMDKAEAFWGILLTDFPSTPEAQLVKKRHQRLP